MSHALSLLLLSCHVDSPGAGMGDVNCLPVFSYIALRVSVALEGLSCIRGFWLHEMDLGPGAGLQKKLTRQPRQLPKKSD